MAPNLTSKEIDFVRRMSQSRDRAEWGFELLLERRSDDLETFFDKLNEEGLFDPENNSGPAPSDREGYFYIPFWPALNYLKAIAKISGEKNDEALAQKVLNVVRSVSRFRDKDGNVRDNYHTFRIFAEIFGLVPITTVTMEDIGLISTWLSSKYERGGQVSVPLDKGILRGALSSNNPEDLEKACKILYYVTSIKWVENPGFEEKRIEPETIVEDFWLKKLVENNTEALGKKIGREASDIFIERLKEVFNPDKTIGPSHWKRPTIEDHEQNYSWEGPENLLVEGLRDTLFHWTKHDPKSSYDYVANLIKGDSDIIRRISIHTINHCWSELQNIYPTIVSVDLFNYIYIHEVYVLLNTHFGDFDDDVKALTLDTIRKLPLLEVEDSERILKREKRNWLSAIVGKGYKPADNWYEELNSDPNIGRLSDHPSFNSYTESWSGPGPSIYTQQELINFARKGTLIEELNNFQEEKNTWRGPTTRALVDVLVETIKNNPLIFVDIIPNFHEAKRPFQYGLIDGFKQLWDVPEKENKKVNINWEDLWQILLNFFEQLINSEEFWKEETSEDEFPTPTRNWIPSVIAEFLRAGTRDDNHAYPPSLLPQGWRIINVLLENCASETEPDEDAMHQAINSSKGKIIEALFGHALRACRVKEKETNQHIDIWNNMRPTFENELNLCRDTNFEFSTLSGSYIANLDYLNREWLQNNIQNIFPELYPRNFTCSLNGMAYAQETRHVYQILVDGGIVDRALRMRLKGQYTREKLIQRIALAYLWGNEKLDEPRFTYLFESVQVDDLQEISEFFWSVSSQPLDDEQIKMIFVYWEKCVAWANQLKEKPEKLLSASGRLSCYVNSIGEHELKLLLAVAPYVHIGHDADRFLEDLDRLADEYPVEANQILGEVLKQYRPFFDFEDRIKSLIRKIANHGGKERLDAIKYADLLHGYKIKGMRELFNELSNEQ